MLGGEPFRCQLLGQSPGEPREFPGNEESRPQFVLLCVGFEQYPGKLEGRCLDVRWVQMWTVPMTPLGISLVNLFWELGGHPELLSTVTRLVDRLRLHTRASCTRWESRSVVMEA